MKTVTHEDIERIEKKLDLIIQHFSIGQTPRRSPKEIDALVDAVVYDILSKKRKNKK